jgi:2-hydroxychromene-2-carboxylate isomerase
MNKAYEIGGSVAQSALFTPIFRAYYEDDLDIGNPEVLADVAEQAAVMSSAEVSALPMRDSGGPERSCISNVFLEGHHIPNGY